MDEKIKIEGWLDGGEDDAHWFSVQRLVMPGEKLRLDYGQGNINNKTLHIRAIVDGDNVVFKHWLKHKKRWNYSVDWGYWFFLQVKNGNLRKA